MNENPFASPQTDAVDLPPTSEVEETRQKYINHEASVRSIGSLCYLGTGFILFSVAIVLLTLLEPGGRGSFTPALLGILVVLVALQIWVGRGLRGLKKWVKIPVALFSVIGILLMLMLPLLPVGLLGMIINGYILYLIFCPKGTFVFSEKYAEVIAQTPHIKYQSSKIIQGFLFVILVVIAIGIGIAFFFNS